MSAIQFGSVCSGIEAASVAWHSLGWRAAWLAEIEPFPSAVLAHHYPAVPNLGDMTRIARLVLQGDVEAPDVLTGGTPCQAFSVAGLRESLADARGNLTLKFVELADAIDLVRNRAGKPASIVIWENVPGVLSTKDNAFGCFLAGLAGEDEPLQPPGQKWENAGCVYGPQRAVAWRTLDAQYFGLAQRRRRVFVVASAREDLDPAQVLFEWDGVRRDSAPRRGEGAGASVGTLGGTSPGGGWRFGADEAAAGRLIAGTLGQRTCDHTSGLKSEADFVVPVAYGGNKTSGARDVASALSAHGGTGRHDFESETFITHAPEVAATMVARSSRGGGQTNSPGHNADEELVVTHSLRGEGFDASEDGTGRGTPLVPVLPFDTTQITSATNRSQPAHGDPCHPLAAGAHPPAIAFDTYNQSVTGDVTQTLCSRGDSPGGNAHLVPAIAFDCKASGQNGFGIGEIASTMRAMGHADSHQNGGGHQAVAYAIQEKAADPNPSNGPQSKGYQAEVAYTLEARERTQFVSTMQVRRLMPEECESLQGFARGYTLIPWRGKPADQCPDGPRYKALGNSWAVPVARWVARRINAQLQRTSA